MPDSRSVRKTAIDQDYTRHRSPLHRISIFGLGSIVVALEWWPPAARRLRHGGGHSVESIALSMGWPVWFTRLVTR